jgi:DNA-directed RNA polymerase subunit omega
MISQKLERTMTDTDKCVAMIGDRFNLVLVAGIRTRELRRGARPLVDNLNASTPVIVALKEIEQGKVGVDYLKKIR